MTTRINLRSLFPFETFELTMGQMIFTCFPLPRPSLFPDLGVCSGGQGHLFHKREVVREAENGEGEEGGRKERGGEGEKEEKDCKAVAWLGEPAPPPPKARLISSK